MSAQLDGDDTGHGDRAGLLALRRREHKLTRDPLKLLVDRDPSELELEPIRGHSKHFPNAKAGEAECNSGAVWSRARREDRRRLIARRHVFGADSAVGFTSTRLR